MAFILAQNLSSYYLIPQMQSSLRLSLSRFGVYQRTEVHCYKTESSLRLSTFGNLIINIFQQHIYS